MGGQQTDKTRIMRDNQSLFKRRRDPHYLYPAGCPCLLHYVPLFPEVTQDYAQL
jgi:hypothetical protein